MNVAKTIYEQLGGGRFAMMTGAKNFISSSDSLTFKLPSKSISHVIIKLNAMDTYDIEFRRIRLSSKTGIINKLVAEKNDVYCDELQRVFTEVTGLYTRL